MSRWEWGQLFATRCCASKTSKRSRNRNGSLERSKGTYPSEIRHARWSECPDTAMRHPAMAHGLSERQRQYAEAAGWRLDRERLPAKRARVMPNVSGTRALKAPMRFTPQPEGLPLHTCEYEKNTIWNIKCRPGTSHGLTQQAHALIPFLASRH